MRFKRKAAIGCVALVVTLCLVYAIAWAVLRTPEFQSWVEDRVRRAGVELTLGAVRLSFPFDLVLSSVHAISPDAFEFSSQEVRADLNPITLIFGELSDLTLVEPRLRIPVAAPAGDGEAAPIDLIVQSLVIQDGQVQLDTGDQDPVTIPNINLEGHDLNLGSQSGEIETTAFIPRLEAELEVRLEAATSGMSANLEMTQRRGPESMGAAPPPPGKSSGKLELHFGPNAGIRLTGKMDFDRFAFGFMAVTGKLDLQAVMDADAKTVALDVKAETAGLSGPLPAIDKAAILPLSAKLTGDYTIQTRVLSLSSIQVDAPAETLKGSATISLAEEPKAEAVVEIAKFELARLEPLLPARANVALPNLEGELSAKLTVSGELSPWSLSGIVETTAAQTKAAGVSIGRLQGTVPFALRQNTFEATEMRLAANQLEWRPPGQELNAGLGSFSITGKLRYASGEATHFDGRVELDGGRFATADGLKAAENIRGTAAVKLEVQGENLVRTQLQTKLQAMEFLWHRFFADFKPEQPQLQISATYDLRKRTLRMETGQLDLARVGAIEWNGTLAVENATPRFELRVRTAGLRLTHAYDFFVRETFKTSHPFIAALTLAGNAGADVVCRGVPDQFTVEGAARLDGMEIGHPDGWRIGPVETELPFRIEYPEARSREAAEPARGAVVVVQHVRFGDTEIPPFTAFLSLWNNTLSLVKPLAIYLYGGSLVVERLAWRDIVAAPRKFSFSGRIDNISLAPMTRDLGWYQFDGSLSGVIPQVHWAEETLRTDGQLEVRVFDGQIKLDELEIRNLAGFLPKIKVNVAIQDINLERVTKVFEFGTISGVVVGQVDGLVISNGQPSQFVADVHTVSRPGVSQWISVEALNKIVVLGSGAEGSAPYGVLAGLFDFYRYRQIGFKARLRNDVLLLEGIKSQDGKEFLVEGSLIPPTVNVVSHMQRIGFKELVSRLERIGQIDSKKTGSE